MDAAVALMMASGGRWRRTPTRATLRTSCAIPSSPDRPAAPGCGRRSRGRAAPGPARPGAGLRRRRAATQVQAAGLLVKAPYTSLPIQSPRLAIMSRRTAAGRRRRCGGPPRTAVARRFKPIRARATPSASAAGAAGRRRGPCLVDAARRRCRLRGRATEELRPRGLADDDAPVLFQGARRCGVLRSGRCRGRPALGEGRGGTECERQGNDRQDLAEHGKPPMRAGRRVGRTFAHQPGSPAARGPTQRADPCHPPRRWAADAAQRGLGAAAAAWAIGFHGIVLLFAGAAMAGRCEAGV
jgi:hypothetical protein